MSKSRFYSKLCLFLLLWAYSPSFKPPGSSSSASTSTGAADVTQSKSSSSASFDSAVIPAGATPQGLVAAEGMAQDVEQDKARTPSPLTPPFELSSPAVYASSIEVDTATTTALPVKGSTDRPVGRGTTSAKEQEQKTPPLSPKPAASSPSSSSSPSSASPSSSLPPSSPSSRNPYFLYLTADPLFLTPLDLTLFTLGVLFLLSHLGRLAGSSLPRALLAAPLPDRLLSRAGTSDCRSREKRWARLRWQAGTIWSSCGPPAAALVALLLSLLAFFALGLITATSSPLKGWNAAPFASLFPLAENENGGWFRLRTAKGFAGSWKAARMVGKVGGPWRLIVGIEAIFTSFTLVSALSPLLISLHLLPTSLPCPRFLSTPPLRLPTSPSIPPRLHLPLPVLLTSLLHIAHNLSTLLQVLLALLARYPIPGQPLWRRWLLHWSTLVLVNALVQPLDAVVVEREKKAAEVGRVGAVLEDFAAARGRSESGEDAEWRCSVCFEGEKERVVGKVSGGRSWWTVCELKCGHRFHASCLAAWLSTQSFCPTCHHPVPSPSSSSSPSPLSTSSSSVLQPAQAPIFTIDPALNAQVNLMHTQLGGTVNPDLYPGAAAAARRAGMRQRQILAPGSQFADDGEGA
ncbi:hypothetical protein JCM8097_003187 [Rhodosporidiobolus ruineniae]